MIVLCAPTVDYPDSVRFGTPSKTECVLVNSIYGAFTRVSIMYANFNLIDENLDSCERRGSTRRLWEVSGCAFCIPYDRCGVALYGTVWVKNENVADTLSWGATTFQSPSPIFVWCTEIIIPPLLLPLGQPHLFVDSNEFRWLNSINLSNICMQNRARFSAMPYCAFEAIISFAVDTARHTFRPMCTVSIRASVEYMSLSSDTITFCMFFFFCSARSSPSLLAKMAGHR